MLLASAALWLWRSPPPPREPTDLCAIYSERLSWYRDSRSVARRWQVPEPMLLAILAQESSLRADARPPRRWFLGFIPGPRPSTAFGYAQVVDATWKQFESEIGRRASRRRFSDAAEFVGWYVTELREMLGIPGSEVERLYLAYHEGPGGYSRGSHRGNASLARRAEQVARRTARFSAQLTDCRAKLDRRLLWRTLRRALAATGAATAIVLALWWRRR